MYNKTQRPGDRISETMVNRRITLVTTMSPWLRMLQASFMTMASLKQPSSATRCKSLCHEKASCTQMLNRHQRGAKTAMALALRSPDLISDLVSVDNAPVDAVLSNDFGGYIQGMKQIDKANITRQKEADDILSNYEKVPCKPPRTFKVGRL